jgi:hypothetical protein
MPHRSPLPRHYGDIAECTVTSAFVSASSVAFSSPWSCELRAEEEGSSLRRVSSLGWGFANTSISLFRAVSPRFIAA